MCSYCSNSMLHDRSYQTNVHSCLDTLVHSYSSTVNHEQQDTSFNVSMAGMSSYNQDIMKGHGNYSAQAGELINPPKFGC